MLEIAVLSVGFLELLILFDVKFLKFVKAVFNSLAVDRDENATVVRPRNPRLSVSSEVHPPTSVHVPILLCMYMYSQIVSTFKQEKKEYERGKGAYSRELEPRRLVRE